MTKYVLSVLMTLAALTLQATDRVEEANRLAREGDKVAARVVLEQTLAKTHDRPGPSRAGPD